MDRIKTGVACLMILTAMLATNRAAATPTPGTPTPAPTSTPESCVPDTLLHTIPNPLPARSDFFGNSVAVSGDMILVGAPGDNPGQGANTGSAYVLNAETGAFVAALNNPSPAAGDNFGYSVALSGNAAVV